MKCPVCDKVNTSMLCPQCGFDSSRDYGQYPTFGPLMVQSASSLRKEWEEKQKTEKFSQPATTIHAQRTDTQMLEIEAETVCFDKKQNDVPGPVQKKRKWISRLIAAVCVVVLGLGLKISAEIENSRTNILRSDMPRDLDSDGYWSDDAAAYPVFGSDYPRDKIRSVTFLDTLQNVPADAWDVSEAGNGAVLAWVEPNGKLYDLFIGAEGGVWAGKSSEGIFAGYVNLDYILFDNAFDTSKVQEMRFMFYNCGRLASLDLSRFNTTNVSDMIQMFSGCSKLTRLELGKNFVTHNANTSGMFLNCPAGADYQHLLN